MTPQDRNLFILVLLHEAKERQKMNTEWEELFEFFDKLNTEKDHMKELQEEIAWTEKHLKELKRELKELRFIAADLQQEQTAKAS